MNLVVMVILVVSAGLVGNKLLNSEQEYTNEKVFEPCQVCDDVEPFDYEAVLASERLQHQLENRIAVHERRERERLAQIELDRKKRLEKERLKRLEENKQIKTQVASRGSGYKGQWQTFEATFYVSSCYKCSGIGAAGVDLRNSIYYDGMRVIAVDPKIIPLWSIVEIETSGGTFKAIALDTGGRINGKIVDVLVASESEAFKNGRQTIKLRMIRRGK